MTEQSADEILQQRFGLRFQPSKGGDETRAKAYTKLRAVGVRWFNHMLIIHNAIVKTANTLGIKYLLIFRGRTDNVLLRPLDLPVTSQPWLAKLAHGALIPDGEAWWGVNDKWVVLG